jgi:hypothetical protein
MPARRWRHPTHRLSLAVGVLILFATLTAVGEALSEEPHPNSPSRQTVPPGAQTYRSMPAVQTPALTALPCSWQYNSSGPNGDLAH